VQRSQSTFSHTQIIQKIVLSGADPIIYWKIQLSYRHKSGIVLLGSDGHRALS